MPDPSRPRLGEPHHLAYVVDDIAATVARLVDGLGAGPFFLVENVPLEDVSSRGAPAEFAHDAAFGVCGGGAIELIRPVRLAPAPVEAGFAVPRPGLQHVAYVVPRAEAAGVRRALDAGGMPEYLSSRLGDVEATLHDATAALGHSLEIHAESEGLRGFFAMVMEAAPLSPIGHVLAPIRRRRPGPGLTPAPAPAYRPPRSGEPERGKGGGGVLSAMQARVLRQHLHDPFPSGAADRRAA